jgi:hypothetical protein
MLLDLNNPFERNKAEMKLKMLIEKKAKIELTEKKPNRTVKQNSYLHAVLTIFAIEYGEKLEYVKQIIFKQLVNPVIFKTEYVNQKSGEIREDWKSTKDLTTAELSTAIERFRNFASENGIYIMSAEEYRDNYFYFKQLEEQNQVYL